MDWKNSPAWQKGTVIPIIGFTLLGFIYGLVLLLMNKINSLNNFCALGSGPCNSLLFILLYVIYGFLISIPFAMLGGFIGLTVSKVKFRK